MKKWIACLLSLVMLLGIVAGCAKNPEGIKGQNTESTGSSTSPSDNSSTPESSLPGESSEPTNGTTLPSDPEPSVTVPQPSQPAETMPEVGTDPGGFGQIYSIEALKAMDTTKYGYGPGTQVDGVNRPFGATTLQKRYGDYETYFIAPDNGDLYLTFDEGYENGYTASILDVLKEKNVHAVFFVTMSYCKNNPELVRRMIDEGHAVGNHSVSHKSMPTLTVEEMIEEVMGLHDYVLEKFGYEMHLFRPPMGEYSKQSLAVVQNLGYKTMEWSFAYYDYDVKKQMEPAKAYEKVVGAAHSGGIFLLHAVSKTNTEILGDVIDEMRRQGFNLALFQ